MTDTPSASAATTFAGLAGELRGTSDARPALVLLHGVSFDRTMWEPALRELQRVDPDRLVLTLDLPGHGESPDWEDYAGERVGAAVHEAILAARLSTPVLVGHSYSGILATMYAARWPVRGVVNVDQTLDVAPSLQFQQQVAVQLRGPGFAEAWQYFAASMHPELLPPAGQELVRATCRPRQPVVLGYWAEGLDRPVPETVAMVEDALEALRQARLPYRIIAGSNPDPAYRHWLAEKLPQATITVFPGSGHFPHLARPDELSRWLAATADWPPSTGGDPARRLLGLLAGYQHTQLLTAMVELGIADEVAAGRHTASELAAATGAQPDALERIVRAAAAVGLVVLDVRGQVELTALGRLLRRGTPDTLRDTVLVHGTDLYPVWGHLAESVRTGEPAFERTHGQPNWAYRRSHPQARARFDAFMSQAVRERLASLLATDALPERGTVVDVGGGNGTLLAAVLKQRPALHGVLVDQPDVIEGATRVLSEAGVADRCAIVGGDFFTAVPSGGQAYVLSAIVLDWDDERAGVILRATARAMPLSAALLVVDVVRPDRPDDAVDLLDLHMLLTNSGGRTRTAPAWRKLLRSNGFDDIEITTTGGLYAVVTAKPHASEASSSTTEDS